MAGGESGSRPSPPRAEAGIRTSGRNANLSTFRARLFEIGLNDQQAAEALGVSLRTITRWKAHNNPSTTARKLLEIVAGHAPWQGWQGWEFHNGYLFPPGYTKHGISPGEFHATVWYRQMADDRKRIIESLEDENARLKAELAELKKRSTSETETDKPVFHAWEGQWPPGT